MASIYDFTVKDNQGRDVSLSTYKGTVLLIVNTATHCGFTPTYTELEKLYDTYHDQGFEILDFPCNQFAGQAPEDDAGIDSFCKMNYGTKFPRFKKIDVNGSNADPLFVFLKKSKGFTGFDQGHPLTPVLTDIYIKQGPGWEKNPDIKWNFTKFLISRDGRVIHRYEPTSPYNRIDKAVRCQVEKPNPFLETEEDEGK